MTIFENIYSFLHICNKNDEVGPEVVVLWTVQNIVLHCRYYIKAGERHLIGSVT
jgi:hypothetical protein